MLIACTHTPRFADARARPYLRSACWEESSWKSCARSVPTTVPIAAAFSSRSRTGWLERSKATPHTVSRAARSVRKWRITSAPSIRRAVSSRRSSARERRARASSARFPGEMRCRKSPHAGRKSSRSTARRPYSPTPTQERWDSCSTTPITRSSAHSERQNLTARSAPPQSVMAGTPSWERPSPSARRKHSKAISSSSGVSPCSRRTSTSRTMCRWQKSAAPKSGASIHTRRQRRVRPTAPSSCAPARTAHSRSHCSTCWKKRASRTRLSSPRMSKAGKN